MGFKKNFIAFLIIGILGTVSHFVYDWTNGNLIAGFIFPVSESVWEHLKLIYYPTAIYVIFEYFIIKDRPSNYITATISGIYCGMLTTVILFYVYTGILGYNVDFINILIYFISVIAVIIKRNKIINSEKLNSENSKIILGVIFGITAFLFAIWSVNPPTLGIFTPPIN